MILLGASLFNRNTKATSDLMFLILLVTYFQTVYGFQHYVLRNMRDARSSKREQIYYCVAGKSQLSEGMQSA